MAKKLTTLELLATTALKTPTAGFIGLGAKSDGVYVKIGTIESKLSVDGHTHTKSQITDFPTTWAWNSISGKPTSLSGYGISAADTLFDNKYQVKDADLTAIAALTGTGFLKRTGTDTWSLDTTSYLPLSGGTITGEITSSTPSILLSVTEITSAPINIKEVNTGSGGFVPMLHAKTLISSGYRKHISIGSYRNGSGYNGGIYLAQGGNDSYPTEYFLLGYGGNITHSSGITFYNSGNLTNLNQLTTRNFSDLQNKPTTLSGYGISVSDTLFDGKYLGINANAVSATYLTSETPQLAASTESNNINIVNNPNSAITNIGVSLASIRKAIQFKWYDTNWQIGNIRGGSSDSAGFGVTYGNSTCYFRITPTTSYFYNNLNASGTVAAPTFIGALSGNASTATTLQTARTVNGTSFNGSADITTANWGTARTLTVGNTGKSVNGSANISWSLSEIGAAAVSQTMYIGTTAVAINRASATLNLTGIGSLAMGGALTGATTIAASTSVTTPKYDLGNSWAIVASGTEIQMQYNGVAKMRFLSDGSIVAVGEITAYS